MAWWRAEDNANDSADSHNGTLEGGMGFTAGVFCQAFDAGSNKRVYVPDSAAFQLTGSLTIGAWINATAQGYCILMRGDNRTGLDPYLLGSDFSSHLVFQITASGSSFKTLSAPLAFNQWEQVTATLDDATGDMRIYVNGTVVAEDFTTVRPFGPLDNSQVPGIGIGNVQDRFDFPFVGGLDEVVLYNSALYTVRSALVRAQT